MNPNLHKALLISVVLLFSVSAGCRRDKFSLDRLKEDWNPTMALPLIKAELGIFNIFAPEDSTELQIKDPSTGLLALVYKSELLSYTAKEVVGLPNQEKRDELSLSPSEISTLVSTGSVTKEITTTHDYLPGGNDIQIDSLLLKNGLINLYFETRPGWSGTVTVTFPGVVRGGIPFRITLPLNGTQFTSLKSTDISGYSVSMSTGPGNYNKIPVHYRLDLSYTDTPPVGNISVSRNFQNWDFQRFYGYVGQQDVAAGIDSTLLRIFNNEIGNGYLVLTNPRVAIDIDNSFGFPINVNMSTLEARNVNNGKITPIELNNFQSPFSIYYPSISQIGSSEKTFRQVDNTNSNIDTLVSSVPKYFVFGFEGSSNPDGPPPANNRNFMTDQSRLRIGTELELPLEGYAYGIGFIDTLEFSFNEDTEYVEWVQFRVNVENGFPLDLKMQIVFLDRYFNRIDSLFTNSNNIALSGTVGPDGAVTHSTTKVNEVKFERARVRRLSDAMYVIVKGETNSYNASASNPSNPSVKLLSHYMLDVKVGMKINSKPGSAIENEL